MRHRPAPHDDLVELGHLGANEAEIVVGRLHAAGLAAMVVGISPFTGEAGAALRFSEGSRILVRRADVEAARRVLAREGPETISDAELAAQAEAATGTDFGDGAVV